MRTRLGMTAGNGKYQTLQSFHCPLSHRAVLGSCVIFAILEFNFMVLYFCEYGIPHTIKKLMSIQNFFC